MSPGNHESAGKRRRAKARKGNRYLRRILVQCAWAARKTPTFLGRTFRRLEVRIGKPKAALALAHKILIIIYHLLEKGTFYDEAYYQPLQARQENRQKKRALKLAPFGRTIRALWYFPGFMGIHNSMICGANKEYPYKSSWIR